MLTGLGIVLSLGVLGLLMCASAAWGAKRERGRLLQRNEQQALELARAPQYPLLSYGFCLKLFHTLNEWKVIEVKLRERIVAAGGVLMYYPEETERSVVIKGKLDNFGTLLTVHSSRGEHIGDIASSELYKICGGQDAKVDWLFAEIVRVLDSAPSLREQMQANRECLDAGL